MSINHALRPEKGPVAEKYKPITYAQALCHCDATETDAIVMHCGAFSSAPAHKLNDERERNQTF